MIIPAPSMNRRLHLRELPAGRPVMRQRWSGLLFLHWPVDAGLIAERLPAGLYVDEFDGRGWLGVVPFFMERVRPVGLPALPWLSWFMELNVRTYVHDADGNPGVWFFSLDCNQPLAVEIARRAFHLPYEHAFMRSETQGRRISFQSRRKAPACSEAAFDYHAPASAAPAHAGSLEWFLVERYLLFSTNPAGEIFCGRVHHRPYQIAAARCDSWSAEPLRLNQFQVPETPPVSMLTAMPVDVAVYPLAGPQSAPSAMVPS